MASPASLQGLGLITLAAILLQIIAVAVSFMYFNKVLNTMQESFSRGSVSCLINTNPHADQDPAEDQKSDPCWRVTQQLHQHIEKAMADRFQKEISNVMRDKLTGLLPVLSPGEQGVPLPKVAAHVTGVAPFTEPVAAAAAAADGPRSSRGYLGERVRAWEGQRGLSFLQNMELRAGELLVPRGGLYYIYAQTYFRLSSAGEDDGDANGDAAEEDGAQLVQYIYKKMSSYTVPILLMKSSRSVCWPRGQEPGLFSLHQAGTAFLQPADRLFITVSNASAMEMDGRASYFGAFLVG